MEVEMLYKKRPVVGQDHRTQAGEFEKQRRETKPNNRAAQAKKAEHLDDVRFCLENDDLLNGWELGFLISLSSFADSDVTAKQLARLGIIVEKVELGVRVLRNRRTRR
jgi:hypothetical protein